MKLDLLLWRDKMLAKWRVEKNIWLLLNIDILKDREVSIYLWAVLYNVAYFEVIL